MTMYSAPGSKRSYEAPKLTVYGDMASLTKTGTGSRVETVAMSGLMRRP